MNRGWRRDVSSNPEKVEYQTVISGQKLLRNSTTSLKKQWLLEKYKRGPWDPWMILKEYSKELGQVVCNYTQGLLFLAFPFGYFCPFNTACYFFLWFHFTPYVPPPMNLYRLDSQEKSMKRHRGSRKPSWKMKHWNSYKLLHWNMKSNIN